jgi:hypothetical protein
MSGGIHYPVVLVRGSMARPLPGCSWSRSSSTSKQPPNGWPTWPLAERPDAGQPPLNCFRSLRLPVADDALGTHRLVTSATRFRTGLRASMTPKSSRCVTPPLPPVAYSAGREEVARPPLARSHDHVVSVAHAASPAVPLAPSARGLWLSRSGTSSSPASLTACSLGPMFLGRWTSFGRHHGWPSAGV